MDYKRIYFSIIENAKLKRRKKNKIDYYELHHILPKCIGGDDSKHNLVLLTAKEHFICHYLLCEIHEDPKLKFAFWAMCNQVSGDVNRNYKVSSRMYERAKKKFSEAISDLNRNYIGDKNPFYGRKHTEETKKHLSNLRKGKRWSTFSFHSEETKKILSAKRKEYVNTDIGKKQLSLDNQQRVVVYCIELDIEFESIKEASKFFNIPYSTMKYRIKKYLKSGEYTFIVRPAH